MQRRPSTQDITWLIDLNNNKQLNLNPPYQRRSVWTRKDKQFFLDSIFRNYPSPAIFLHKTINEAGKATYHVVDGKQRTQTILDFVTDKIRISKEFGDVRLDGKKWSQLKDQDLKTQFWNYQVTVEMIDFSEGSIINEVFDRLNRNARRLTPQELRHAKFDGWFITLVETESSQEEWASLGISTKSRAKRMVDCQFISELILVTLEGDIFGFDQENLDELYGKYDEIDDESSFDEEAWKQRYQNIKDYLLKMENHNHAITEFGSGFGNFYTLWSLVALSYKDLPEPSELSQLYSKFMKNVNTLSKQDDLVTFLRSDHDQEFTYPNIYLNNSRGASTDLEQRKKRLDALRSSILQ